MKKNLLIVLCGAAVAWSAWLGCNAQPATKPTTSKEVKGLAETAFRAGANIAAKLIWENPDKYRTSAEVQEAAWDYARTTFGVSGDTNAP